LPIKTLNFNTEVFNEKVEVSCSTCSEINNDFFTIEKSMDLKNWEIAGKLYGAGNSNKLIYYKITDNNHFYGNSFYRLKQTDFDGKSTYSEAVKIFVTYKFTKNN
jgi:hypothetical protein